MAEIELKFVTRENASGYFVENIVPRLNEAGMSVSDAHTMTLQNDYFDTPDHAFQRYRIGFRVRGCNGNFEQTVKTQGRVRGGLHERGEYNVPLTRPEPDLTLFERDIWPADFPLDDVVSQLQPQFSTHFVRTAFDVTCNDSVIELVFDEGEVSTGKASAPIHEIELEIKSGNVADIFVLATELNKKLSLRLSDVSKAAQGYQLLHGLPAHIKPLPEVLPLPQDINTEDAFERAVTCALNHWQWHEHLFLETGSIKMLAEVEVSIRLLLQSVSLYLPVLQCPDMLKLHKQLLAYAQNWLWQDDLQALRYLLSKKGMFTKCLSKHSSMVSYLQGRKAGLLHAHNPSALFYDPKATGIKLAAAELVQTKPWQRVVKGYDLPVMEHAKGWLSQGWQTVQQSMPQGRAMRAVNYSSIEMLLRQILWNGFLLADLFSDDRSEFRAPWLDLLTGIEELKALLMLKQALQEAELETMDELNEWVHEKINSLIRVMERTRTVAMDGDVYW